MSSEREASDGSLFNREFNSPPAISKIVILVSQTVIVKTDIIIFKGINHQSPMTKENTLKQEEDQKFMDASEGDLGN